MLINNTCNENEFEPVFLAMLSQAEVLEIIGGCFDPDKVQMLNGSGHFAALWMDGGYSKKQLLMLRENPRVFIHTKVLAPRQQPYTHQIILSILPENNSQFRQKFIPGDVVRREKEDRNARFEVIRDNGNEARIKPLQAYTGGQPLNADGTLTVMTCILDFCE
jgi:hypothetical protein